MINIYTTPPTKSRVLLDAPEFVKLNISVYTFQNTSVQYFVKDRSARDPTDSNADSTSSCAGNDAVVVASGQGGTQWARRLGLQVEKPLEAPRGRLIAVGRMHDHGHEWSDHKNSRRVLGLARRQIHAGRVFDAFALVSFAFTSENSAEDDRLREAELLFQVHSSDLESS